MATAVAAAAAAQDVEEEEQEWQQQQQQELNDLPALRSMSWAGSKHGHSHTSARHVAWRPRSMVVTDPGGGVDAGGHPSDLRLGSTVTAASVSAAKAEALQQRVESGHTAEGTPVYSVAAGSKAPGWEKLYPSIAGGIRILNPKP